MIESILNALDTLGYIADTPGAYTRGALSGRLGERRSGREMLTDWGVTSENDESRWELGDILGALAEMVADPTNLVGAGALTKAAKVSKASKASRAAAKSANDAAQVVNMGVDARRAMEPKAIARLTYEAPPMHNAKKSVVRSIGEVLSQTPSKMIPRNELSLMEPSELEGLTKWDLENLLDSWQTKKYKRPDVLPQEADDIVLNTKSDLINSAKNRGNMRETLEQVLGKEKTFDVDYRSPHGSVMRDQIRASSPEAAAARTMIGRQKVNIDDAAPMVAVRENPHGIRNRFGYPEPKTAEQMRSEIAIQRMLATLPEQYQNLVPMPNETDGGLKAILAALAGYNTAMLPQRGE